MADGPRLNNAEKRKRAIEYGMETIEVAEEVRDPSCVQIPNGDSISSLSSSAFNNPANLANIMTRPLERDSRLAQYRGEFSSRVHRDWVRSKDPCAVVTEDTPAHVRTLMVRPNDLNIRMGSTMPQHSWSWVFELWLTNGKALRNIALALDDNRQNFCIKSVTGDRGQRLGTCDGHEWYDDSLPSVNASSSILQQQQQQHDNNPTNNADNVASHLYTVEIGFGANKFGTYRQHLLFGFGDYPILRRRLCVDCVHFEDLKRLSDATKYVLHQTSHRWTSPDSGGVVHPFESPFVLAKDPREDFLTKAYPYPVENDFMLSHATLTEDSITPSNYRGRMHELISVEELARHEQVARYNRVAQLKLSSSYILSSDTDGSTTAKYAPPGELFAEVGIILN